MKHALHDAAKQSARDEVARMGVHVSDYVIGRIVEATAAVLEGRPIHAESPCPFCDQAGGATSPMALAIASGELRVMELPEDHRLHHVIDVDAWEVD